jgi:hypothetical protein
MFGGMYTVWDYKTTSGSITDFYSQRFEIDIQNHIYTIAARTLSNHTFSTFLIDAIGVGVTYTDMQRFPIQLTNGELDEALLDIEGWIKQGERYAEANYYPKNTRACGFCQFNQICNKSPEIRIRFLESHFTEQRRKFVGR